MDVNRVSTNVERTSTDVNANANTNTNANASANVSASANRASNEYGANGYAASANALPSMAISTQTIAGSVVSGRAEGQEFDVEGLQHFTTQLNRYLSPFRRQMDIGVHEPTQRITVTIKDTVEDIVIREIPPEQMLDAFVAALEFNGLLLDERG
jgi:flagellar protein FlaG